VEAVAGATALAATAGRVAAGILALCAAGLGAVMTTLNAARRAEQAHVAGNDYLGLLRMEELTRADLATLKSGDRLLVKDYDADGEGDYIDHVVVVVEVERDGEEFAVVWHLEHPDYDHDEALDGEVVEEMLGSLYRLD